MSLTLIGYAAAFIAVTPTSSPSLSFKNSTIQLGRSCVASLIISQIFGRNIHTALFASTLSTLTLLSHTSRLPEFLHTTKEIREIGDFSRKFLSAEAANQMCAALEQINITITLLAAHYLVMKAAR